MYQASNPPRATRGDMAVRENAPVAPTDLPAPGEAVAVPSPLGTAAASTIANPCPESAELLLSTARALHLAGKPIPSDLERAARLLLALDQPMSAHGPKSGPTETIEITTAEMARRMGCSARHVRRLIPEGSLRARRAGRDWLITVEQEEDE